MSTKYKFIDKQGIYFTTSTVVGWLDIFTRDLYRDIPIRRRSPDLCPTVTNAMS